MNHWNSRQIPNAAVEQGNYLELTLPLRAFVTLTTPYGISREAFEYNFSCWIHSTQESERFTFGWIRSYEKDPRLHMHAVLVAPKPINCIQAAERWNGLVGWRSTSSAKVEPYFPARLGLAYVLKSLDRWSEDVQFSSNLPAFQTDADVRPFYGKTSAEKRQIHRIQKQMGTGCRVSRLGEEFRDGTSRAGLVGLAQSVHHTSRASSKNLW